MPTTDTRERAFFESVRRGTALVGIDHDGVLSPIVANPLLARPLPENVAAVSRLVTATPVMLPSGRSVAFLRERVPVPGVYFSGLYGRQWTTHDGRVETHPEAKRVRRSLAQARTTSANALRQEGLLGQGVWIEDKDGLAFAVHYRPLIARIKQLRQLGERGDQDQLFDLTSLLDDVSRRVPVVLGQVAQPLGLVVTSSNKVSEMSGPGFDKQRAVIEGVDRLVAEGREIDAVAYFGDEKRDLPAFDALDALAERGINVFRIAVGGDELNADLRSRADRVLPDPIDVAAYLGGLADFALTRATPTRNSGIA